MEGKSLCLNACIKLHVVLSHKSSNTFFFILLGYINPQILKQENKPVSTDFIQKVLKYKL